MGASTGIAWTDATWNPIRGCSRVSEGCRHCYAEQFARRIPTYREVVRLVGSEWRWTGDVQLVAEALDLPLHWRKPRRIFVNSMSDLFHEKVLEAWWDKIVTVMANAERHTFQVLTKRPEIMRYRVEDWIRRSQSPFPSNVWLGVSVEDQAAADARLPLLLQTPAAVRFVSLEPLLGPVNLDGLWGYPGSATGEQLDRWPIHWLIAGGESGPGARPCDLAWIRSIVEQGRAAGVPVFVKQLGARTIVDDSDFLGKLGPYVREAEDGSNEIRWYHRAGADSAEWPEDLRVQEFPPRATAGSPRP